MVAVSNYASNNKKESLFSSENPSSTPPFPITRSQRLTALKLLAFQLHMGLIRDTAWSQRLAPVPKISQAAFFPSSLFGANAMQECALSQTVWGCGSLQLVPLVCIALRRKTHRPGKWNHLVVVKLQDLMKDF